MKGASPFAKGVHKRMQRCNIRVTESARTCFEVLDKETRARKYLLPGITKRLHDCFYPHEPKRRTRAKRQAMGIRGHRMGAKNGTITHLWVRHLVNCAVRCSCPRNPENVSQPKIAKHCIPDKTLAVRFVQDAHKLGYDLLMAEVPVWSIKYNVMTMLDVLLKNRTTGALACIELKTGNIGDLHALDAVKKNQFFKGTAFARDTHDRNTVHNRHMLQAVVGSRLYNGCHETEQNGTVSESWVVYLNEVTRVDAFRHKELKCSWYKAHEASWAQHPEKLKQIFIDLAVGKALS